MNIKSILIVFLNKAPWTRIESTFQTPTKGKSAKSSIHMHVYTSWVLSCKTEAMAVELTLPCDLKGFARTHWWSQFLRSKFTERRTPKWTPKGCNNASPHRSASPPPSFWRPNVSFCIAKNFALPKRSHWGWGAWLMRMLTQEDPKKHQETGHQDKVRRTSKGSRNSSQLSLHQLSVDHPLQWMRANHLSQVRTISVTSCGLSIGLPDRAKAPFTWRHIATCWSNMSWKAALSWHPTACHFDSDSLVSVRSLPMRLALST